jgi:hypothetical protein
VYQLKYCLIRKYKDISISITEVIVYLKGLTKIQVSES